MKDSQTIQRLYHQQKELAISLHRDPTAEGLCRQVQLPADKGAIDKSASIPGWGKAVLKMAGDGVVPLLTNRKNTEGRRHCTLRVDAYFKEIVSRDLVLQCLLDTAMDIMPPKKLVLSTSSKEMVQDKRQLAVGLAALKLLSGQKSQTTRARKSIAAFKLREGGVIGCKVTLRGKGLYSFLEKLLFLVFPRVRSSLVDQGIDTNSNFNIGISDPFIFIELEGHYDLFQSLQGINIALITSIKQKTVVELVLTGLQIKLK